ncbi:sirohydrochlorin chelatase [Salinarchaeum sp. IM2453]|uniref:sirohydrochlorin chelatase n=1 Tax=Salinarchaeum sp. IM2453 TaxID=2862870 RepID=UPI001C82C291|nr:sirohydrochlorin chelatase [Salinarchaeum sp. IM2453]QZA88086.1 sirohydrochlorin chelatase [Salinarchaeum sp. IM2453]
MTTDHDEAILLIGHGSPEEQANSQVETIVEAFDQHIDVPVQAAFVEQAHPAVDEAIISLADDYDEIVVLPLLLFGAKHVKIDIPLKIEQARKEITGATVRYGSHLGVHAGMIDLVANRIAVAESELEADRISDEIAVVFCPKGSSDPDANADTYKFARLLYEGREFTTVNPAFLTMTDPVLDDVLHMTANQSPDAIIVVPYMFGDGVLTERIRNQADDFTAEYSDIEVTTTNVVGSDVDLIDVLIDRWKEARGDAVSMSCDTCQYRMTLADLETEVGGKDALIQAIEHQHAHDHDHGHSHDHSHGHTHSH